MAVKHMLTTSLLLGVFAITGTAMVALTFDNTEVRIIDNEYQALLQTLNALVPPASHDNDIANDTVEVTSRGLLGSNKSNTAYLARMKEIPIAAVITTIAPDGYNGAIKLLVAINYNGTISGVRVLSHRETPGLGDSIEVERSNWINNFRGLSLLTPDDLGWRVQKDGGIFDQFTGATVTPRAVVKAVHNTLLYFDQHRDELFKMTDEAHTATQVSNDGQ
ncbi:Electron transport complex protein RnfG [hydrothermal vent metagenome]|uniref:Electron transport complex protein RnfG n=1 Tax=hydrothermal vent metagenome TaxID=652676 RepID=A0A3B0ZJG9_9ZZZZ